MALLDFLKNKKEKDKAKEKKSQIASVAKESKKEAPAGEVKTSLQGREFSYNVIKEPHISEKGTVLADRNTYIFKIYHRANKPEIKKAVEGIYGVNVVKVNVVTIPQKKRRLGRTEGFKKSYKKAMVTLKEGQKIELF